MMHELSGGRGLGLVALMVLVVALGAGGLGCGGPSVPATDAARAVAGVAAAEPRSQDLPGPALRAFLKAAVATQKDIASLRWSASALQAFEGEESLRSYTLPALPATVQRAFTAFDEWGRSGEPVRWASYRDDVDVIFFAVSLLRLLSVVVEHSDDPRVTAALRFAHQLRTSGSSKVIGEGCSLAADWAKTLLLRRKEPVTQAFRTYAVTEQDVMAFGRAFVAESLQKVRQVDHEDLLREAFEQGSSAHPQAPRRAGEPRSGVVMYQRLLLERYGHGLSTDGYWMDEELLLAKAFWDETELAISNAADSTELYHLMVERHLMATGSPASMLLRFTSREHGISDQWHLMEVHISEATLFANLLAKEGA